MTQTRQVSIVFAFFVLVASSACSKSNSASGGGASVVTSLRVPTGVTAASTNRLASLDLSSMFQLGSGGAIRAAGNVGTATAAGVLSLKYLIFGISVCQDMSTSGTAFSSPTGCLSIYDSGVDNQDGTWGYTPSSMDLTTMAATVKANESQMIDLMDSTSRAKLTKTVSVTSDNAHDYNWGFITWYPAIAATGQVVVGGQTLSTKDGTIDPTSGVWTTSSSLIGGTPAEAVVGTGNGGTWFRFQNPLTISAADVSNGTIYNVDLAFNPDGYFKGVTPGGLCGGTCMIKDTSNNAMTVPELSITPIPHKASEHVMRETYIATVNSTVSPTDGPYQLRVQFYYLDDDATKAPYGVDVNTILSSSSQRFVYDLPKISYVDNTNTDGSLNLETWDKSKLIQNFTRKTTLNDTTTATVNCGSLSGGQWSTDDCTNGTSMSLTFTLTEVGTLN